MLFPFPAGLRCLALPAPAGLWGQGELATFTGAVRDSTKAVIAGVEIALRHTETYTAHSVLSNAEGYFTVTELEPGLYGLTASKVGFRLYRESRIVLQIGEQLRADYRTYVPIICDGSSKSSAR